MDLSPDRLPVRVDKPWGYEIWYAWTDRYVGKILHVRRGHRLSLQYHREKDETSYVLRGRLLLTTGPTEDRLSVTEIGEGHAWRTLPARSTPSRRSRTRMCSRSPRPSSMTSCGSGTSTAARARTGPDGGTGAVPIGIEVGLLRASTDGKSTSAP